jgi:hypothetical protein
MSNQATDTARAAADAGTEIARTAATDVKQVAETAVEQTGRVASELGTQARTALDQATAGVKEQANEQTARMAESLRGIAGELQALVDGRPDEAGRFPDLARQATDQLQTFADSIGQRGIEGILDETQRFARRRPGMFLAGAAIAGFAAGRLLRGAKAAPELGVTPPQPAVAPADRLAGATTEGTDVIVLPNDVTAPPTVLAGRRDGAV